MLHKPGMPPGVTVVCWYVGFSGFFDTTTRSSSGKYGQLFELDVYTIRRACEDVGSYVCGWSIRLLGSKFRLDVPWEEEWFDQGQWKNCTGR
jgi:hypothetical protein